MEIASPLEKPSSRQRRPLKRSKLRHDITSSCTNGDTPSNDAANPPVATNPPPPAQPPTTNPLPPVTTPATKPATIPASTAFCKCDRCTRKSKCACDLCATARISPAPRLCACSSCAHVGSVRYATQQLAKRIGHLSNSPEAVERRKCPCYNCKARRNSNKNKENRGADREGGEEEAVEHCRCILCQQLLRRHDDVLKQTRGMETFFFMKLIKASHGSLDADASVRRAELLSKRFDETILLDKQDYNDRIRDHAVKLFHITPDTKEYIKEKRSRFELAVNALVVHSHFWYTNEYLRVHYVSGRRMEDVGLRIRKMPWRDDEEALVGVYRRVLEVLGREKKRWEGLDVENDGDGDDANRKGGPARDLRENKQVQQRQQYSTAKIFNNQQANNSSTPNQQLHPTIQNTTQPQPIPSIVITTPSQRHQHQFVSPQQTPNMAKNTPTPHRPKTPPDTIRLLHVVPKPADKKKRLRSSTPPYTLAELKKPSCSRPPSTSPPPPPPSKRQKRTRIPSAPHRDASVYDAPIPTYSSIPISDDDSGDEESVVYSMYGKSTRRLVYEDIVIRTAARHAGVEMETECLPGYFCKDEVKETGTVMGVEMPMQTVLAFRRKVEEKRRSDEGVRMVDVEWEMEECLRGGAVVVD